MQEGAQVPPKGDSEASDQDAIVPADRVPLTKMSTTKLVITFYDKARCTQKSVEDGLNRSLDSPTRFFVSVFAEIAPTYDIQSYQSLAPGISQANCLTHESQLLHFASLRHTSPITNFEAEHNVELIFDQFPLYHQSTSPRPLKIALFDMDSTLINEEVIDELARSVGVSDAVSAITARAMSGDIDFATSLKERVGMLKGVPTTVWQDLRKTVTIATGARELIAGLRKKGVYTAVASGGFTPMAEWLKGELGLDLAVANHLLEAGPTEEFPYAHLSGQLDPAFPIVTPQLKKDTLLRLAAKQGVAMHETLAVGDGSNDLLMLGTAGLGIAWKAKAKVQVKAPMRLNGESLRDLLYLFGSEEA